MESLLSLRALLVASRPKSWNLGYPPAVRARVAAYVTARREAGVRMDAIADELDVSRHSAVAWSRSLPAPEQPMQRSARAPPQPGHAKPSTRNTRSNRSLQLGRSL